MHVGNHHYHDIRIIWLRIGKVDFTQHDVTINIEEEKGAIH